MSSEILQMIITGLVTLLSAGGIGSIFYFKQERKIKDAEVKSAEITNESSTNEEWKKLCDVKSQEIDNLKQQITELNEKLKEKEDKLIEVYNSKESAWEETSNCKIQSAKKDRIISELNWYRCEVNGCPYRKPPRKYGTFDFPKDAVIQTEDETNNE
jgi:ribosomal protein L11 methylase PrmA